MSPLRARRRPLSVCLLLLVSFVMSSLALASTGPAPLAGSAATFLAPNQPNAGRVPRVWQVDFTAPGPPSVDLAVPVDLTLDDQATQTRPRPVAFQYSDAYYTRLKIHKYASFATVPLFVTQYVLGKKLYDGNYTGTSVKTAHAWVAGSIGVLFGVNTVTGVWNLWEARKNPNGRTKRTVHGVLMLAADAGFVATGLLAPEADDFASSQDYLNRRSTHRTVAITSRATALVGYAIMIIWR
jgi:hypothetical protein